MIPTAKIIWQTVCSVPGFIFFPYIFGLLFLLRTAYWSGSKPEIVNTPNYFSDYFCSRDNSVAPKYSLGLSFNAQMKGQSENNIPAHKV